MPRKRESNQLTSPELLDQVLQENKTLAKDFLAYLKSTKRSETTIAGYEHDLAIWMCWNLQYNGNKLFTDMKKRDLVAFQSWLIEENGNSPARVRRIKAALSSMSNYIENVLDDEYDGFRSIIHKVESPIVTPVYEKTVLTPDDVTKILSVLTERKQYQKACAFALAISCGARKSELTRFKVEFFDEQNIIFDSLYKTPPIKTKGRGGGKYLNKYVLISVFKPYLDIWLAERDRLGIDSEWLFVSRDASGVYRQISAESMTGWTQEISKIIGRPFYWHSARHYWTSYLLSAGIPNDVVSDLSGWASVDMVSTYDDRDKDEAFAKYFRGGKIVAAERKALSDL